VSRQPEFLSSILIHSANIFIGPGRFESLDHTADARSAPMNKVNPLYALNINVLSVWNPIAKGLFFIYNMLSSYRGILGPLSLEANQTS
jgi:hypothetical protein